MQNFAEVWKVEEVDGGIIGLTSAWNVSAISSSVQVLILKVENLVVLAVRSCNRWIPGSCWNS